MHGAPGKFRAVFERLPLRFKPRKRRQQRRMNIQDATRKRRDEIRRKQTHVSREANEIDFFSFSAATTSLSYASRSSPFDGITRASESARPCALHDSRRVFAIAHHDAQFPRSECVRRQRFRPTLRNSSRARKATRAMRFFMTQKEISIVRQEGQTAQTRCTTVNGNRRGIRGQVCRSRRTRGFPRAAFSTRPIR